MLVRFRPFRVPALTRSDLAVHLVSTILNGGLTLFGAIWVIAHWGAARPEWPLIVLAVLVGLFAADFISGLLHWAFDTWFDEEQGTFARLVVIVREHHIYPQNIFQYRFRDESGPIALASLAFTAPVYGVVMLSAAGPGAIGLAAIVACLVVSFCMALMLQCHKLGHRKARSKVLRILQKMHLIMGPRHHGQHHRDNHDIRYCLINGWADLVFDKIGFWRWLERSVASATGAVPRCNDHDWLGRYGRRIGPRRLRPVEPTL